jgi:hypothetical protein
LVGGKPLSREIGIGFLRRILGSDRVGARTEETPAVLPEAKASESEGNPGVEAEAAATATLPVKPITSAACPYCGVLLDPAPERGRLCPRCRRKIVVRRVEGRLVLLTEEALDVFEGERDRETKERAWTVEQRNWLGLAKSVSAPEDRIARLSAARPSEAIVVAARELYLATAERGVRTARREKRWEEVARIRRAQAAALYRASGSAVPPPEDVVALHREWSAAALRFHAGIGAQVELVASGCCAICGRDNGRAFTIAAELRGQRLPHQGCPKGLCPCDWWPLPGEKPRAKRARRRDPGQSGTADPAR